RGGTLLASLHAVDLALQHFPRVIGLRAGRIAFDLPAGEVDRAALDALYANEQLQADHPGEVLQRQVHRVQAGQQGAA
ncbi:hypothetical protein ACV34T_32015, partial [Pseudomonas aeruginosa]